MCYEKPIHIYLDVEAQACVHREFHFPQLLTSIEIGIMKRMKERERKKKAIKLCNMKNRMPNNKVQYRALSHSFIRLMIVTNHIMIFALKTYIK